MKLGREVSRHNELDNWRNTHRLESVMATKWLLLTISETEPGFMGQAQRSRIYYTRIVIIGPDIDWVNSGEALASFPPAAIVLIAATVITLAVIAWAIVWLARRGETGQNRFGPDPRR